MYAEPDNSGGALAPRLELEAFPNGPGVGSE
jgi:hypothetical protein